MTDRAPRHDSLIIRRSPRAKRMLLRVDTRSGAVVLTLPARVPEAEGLAFVERQQPWIARARAALPPTIRFEPGATLPILGHNYTVHHDPKARRTPTLDPAAATLTVGGDAAEVANRIRRFLRSHALSVIAPKTAALVERIGHPPVRVRVGDPRSRWGSCSSSGMLSFSWRLVLAPEWVVDYVIAHEVAHLQEMNHSARFWKVVASLVPTAEAARTWLRREGQALHRIG